MHMGKDDVTWLNISYVLFALVVAFITYKAVGALGVQLGWTERYDAWFPLFNNIVAIFLGASAALWLRSSMVRRDYHLSAIGEVRKVSWPSLEDTKKMTLIVAVVVAIFSVILSIFDVIWAKILQFVLP
jgi:preprotein translocase SecE subunit